MTMLKAGDKAPVFKLPADGNKEITLENFKGKKVVLYFYPKDDTPGCTKQACAFRDNLPAFEKLNTTVIGISKDSVKKHDNFKKKYDLNFALAADEDGKTLDAYGVWKEKSMYGKTFMGIERTTFLIGEDGKILRVWEKVKVPGHIEEVKGEIEKFKAAA